MKEQALDFLLFSINFLIKNFQNQFLFSLQFVRSNFSKVFNNLRMNQHKPNSLTKFQLIYKVKQQQIQKKNSAQKPVKEANLNDWQRVIYFCNQKINKLSFQNIKALKEVQVTTVN
ncbi:hypothetical protein TTHERM_000035519 (macronuclear) [Tetrahymena thermophila SB210]|uniref:Uncharacterized protein n=1 Tax=Tetrahymena thermophila (strain SB210) TaxID=312017 RepID=W7XE87_TETTS|nr:hypothetical protein TTHERM_000035519 [Tetrahymena thermophila SB210]EWS74873.1 hypothetical protein TTHERM_000035519 [Tetrahymena thermophila SB210]|eukprot:XP_012652586.1 hypothetical protein TTHERM_000035519 [Tetrahymena thermophila SB210]